jgi:carboxyl-terminal processing protease
LFPSTPRSPARPTLLFILFCGLFFVGFCRAEPEVGLKESIAALMAKAEGFKKAGQWAEACRCYDELARKDRLNVDRWRGLYHQAYRRLQLTIRHTDPIYVAELKRLSVPQALDLYEQVLSVLAAAHPDRASYGTLHDNGLQELRHALKDEGFLARYFPDVKPDALAAFKAKLDSWPLVRITSRADARAQAMAVSRAASRAGIPIRPGTMPAIILEFAAGSCNALDEHSLFVTPGQLGLLRAALAGKLVSTGLEMQVRDGKLIVWQVVEGSTAAEKGIQKGDLVLKIGGVSVEALPADAAAEKLRGRPGTTVEVVLNRPGHDDFERITVKLVRRAAPLPSVELVRDDSGNKVFPLGDGYGAILRINYFAEDTLATVKSLLSKDVSAATMGQPLKGLILDLRGNPGGLFDSSVDIAGLFLPEGVIVIGSSPFKKYNKPFKADGTGPYQMPVVVLIDSDTASAAEVLAGAIKDIRGPRGTAILVGETTYGKGSIQCLIPIRRSPLDKPAALKLTVAKLFSPTNQPYTGRGITPDVEASPNAAMAAALKELQKLVAGTMPTTPPAPPAPSPSRDAVM